LDEASEIKDVFHKQFGHLLHKEEGEMTGDVGGSSVQVKRHSHNRMNEGVGSHVSSKHKTAEVIAEADEEDEEEDK
jgi:hypothetical protein